MSDANKDLYRPETQNQGAARAILIVTSDKTEDLEFFYPYYRFLEAGYRVDVATPSGSSFKGKQGLGLKTSRSLKEVREDDYALLYLPGGKAPAELKTNADVLSLTRQFAASGKPIAAVCHGPQILAAAGVIDKRQIAAWPETKDEITAAGAIFTDQETIVDGPFITARWPGDLPAHLKETLKILEQSKTSRAPLAA